MTVDEGSPHNVVDTSRGRAEFLPAKAQPSRRRYELDWLRVVIILGAMVLHAVYELEVYFPQARSETLTQVGYTFAIQWGLPLLFLIAGASAWLSLAHRTLRQFIRERVLHVLVPFIACALTVIPISLYLASLISSSSHVPFFQFYADYFQGYAHFFHGNPIDHLTALWDDLWFILVIFLLTVLTAPFILLLKGRRGRQVISGLSSVCGIPGGTLMIGLIFVACSWFLGMVMPASVATALWLVILCVLSFIAGALLYADPSIEQAIARDGPAALLLATLCFVIEQILVIQQVLPPPHSGGYIISAILSGSFPWLGAIGFLGLTKRYFSFTNRTLEYLKAAVFPYFLLHMLMLSLFAYIFLVHTDLSGVVQGVAIIACSVLSLALLYEFLIKRNAVLRFLFGLKSQPRA